jgi:hypothetical protein
MDEIPKKQWAQVFESSGSGNHKFISFESCVLSYK